MKNQQHILKFKNSELTTLLLGRKGGRTTVRILDLLLEHPYNINQLAKILKLDYGTIKHHINLISKSDLIEGHSEVYGGLYFPSKKLINNLNEYFQIREHLINS